MKVLIVEDEPYAQQELKRLLNLVPYDIKVLECVDSIEETSIWLNSNPEPDLMFLDIQLSDGLSFEIFKKSTVSVPVIFTTAFDAYAIQAFKVNSIDYLLKPIKQDELEAALNKYQSMRDRYGESIVNLNVEQVEQLLKLGTNQYKSRFIAKVGDQIKHIAIADVAYFHAEDNVVMLITKGNDRYIIEYSLDQLNELIDPEHFFRVNRSYIVTVDAIEKINKYFNSRLHLELRPGTDDNVLISRVKVQDFLNWIDQ